ncbi:fluoride efflux transporter CrcB [Erythrobacter arachoides]|uniref:Fluoride-specific ion channel FluC n=1 Tax=Aurantiacibacter arachoides TaxID=1850444 RepID=A0A844ZVS2_9SPHN|nr:CrcB family protein [Aurantiacibacter arachoides]MXO92401.1 fluoride efflux transporter CrcB [Aurantiacibacter arachoides]GGD57460.1 putative fluoride ion transporter CrcB [Aurantiacibacter arachoides]
MSTTLPQLWASLSVALAGGIGAVARYQLGRAVTWWLGPPVVGLFPFPTLAVNTLGSVLMGALAGWLVRAAPENAEQLRLLLGVGLLGGFTTFSAFSLELAFLIERQQVGLAAIYLMLSVGLGVTGFAFGVFATKAFA